MPIPVSPMDEKGNFDLSACIRFLRKENPEMDSKQRIAVCLNVARKAHGKSNPKGK